MTIELLRGRDFLPEIRFSASRSSGPGGQNVNKVSSKVELRFDIDSSSLLTPEEKEIIRGKLASKINSEGELIIVSQTERSQVKNKEKVIAKFYDLLRKALKPRKKRKATEPSQEAIEKRLEKKRKRSEKKSMRRIKPTHQ